MHISAIFWCGNDFSMKNTSQTFIIHIAKTQPLPLVNVQTHSYPRRLQKRQYEGLADFLNEVARDEVRIHCRRDRTIFKFCQYFIVSRLLVQTFIAKPSKLTPVCAFKVEQLPEYVNLKISVIFCPEFFTIVVGIAIVLFN